MDELVEETVSHFKRDLAALNLRDALPPRRTILYVHSNTPIREAFEIMRDNNVLALPVFDAVTNKKLGFVDQLDLLSFVLRFEEAVDAAALKERDLLSLWDQNCNEPVSRIMGNSSEQGRYEWVPFDAPLQMVVAKFARGVHRIAVHESPSPDAPITHIFSQSAFLRFLSENLWVLGALGDKTAVELGLGSTAARDHLVTVQNTTPVIAALRLMDAKKLSAVAVVDEEGHLFSQFSASDLRQLSLGTDSENNNNNNENKNDNDNNLIKNNNNNNTNNNLHNIHENATTTNNNNMHKREKRKKFNLKSLEMGVAEALKLIREEKHQKGNMLVWSLPGSTLAQIVQLMARARVHRIYLIDNYVNLFGVVSITDVARLLERLEV
jgi:CBS domain-containing protein